MADESNLFDLSETVINLLWEIDLLKFLELVQNYRAMAHEEIECLFTHIKEPTLAVNQLLSINERWNSDLIIQKMFCNNLNAW